MANFTGSECMICKQTFNENDDIVVCPECGTPYHRECYLKEGKCINTELHLENKSWSDINRVKSEQSDEQNKKCSRCGAENKPHTIICEICGAPMVDDINLNGNTGYQQQNANFGGFSFDPQDKYCGFDPKEKISESTTVEEAADFVGENSRYYLMLFKRMKMTGKKITVNAMCIFLPQVYFAYRKMWKEAAAVIVLSSILSIPALLYTFTAMDMPIRLISVDTLKTSWFGLLLRFSNYASMAVNVGACLFGNWLYYRHMDKKIDAIKTQLGSENDMAAAKIKESGGVNIWFVLLAFAVQLVAAALIVFLFMK